MSHKPFRDAIHASPGDSLPKRVYADWLEEHGMDNLAAYWRRRAECRVLTLELAKQLKPGDVLYAADITNKNGEAQRWRVNGKVKTWKRDPGKIYVPLKCCGWRHLYFRCHNGLYLCDSLTQASFTADGTCKYNVLLDCPPPVPGNTND